MIIKRKYTNAHVDSVHRPTTCLWSVHERGMQSLGIFGVILRLQSTIIPTPNSICNLNQATIEEVIVAMAYPTNRTIIMSSTNFIMPSTTTMMTKSLLLCQWLEADFITLKGFNNSANLMSNSTSSCSSREKVAFLLIRLEKTFDKTYKIRREVTSDSISSKICIFLFMYS